MNNKKYKSLGKRTFIFIIIIGLIISIGALAISYRSYYKATINHYYSLSVEIANTVDVMMDANEVKKYSDKVYDIYKQNPASNYSNEDEYLKQYESVIDAGYMALHDKLAALKNATGVDSLYIIRLEESTKTGVYVLDSEVVAPGLWDPLYDENIEIFKDPKKGFEPYVTNTKEYGWLVSTGIPIILNDEVIGYYFVDISMNDIMNDIQLFIFNTAIILIIITLILSCFLYLIMNYSLVMPLKKLSEAARKFTSEKHSNNEITSSLQSITIKSNDEVEMLFDSFKQMEIDINSYIDMITNITAEKERIGAELNVATQIQADMLPNIFPAFPDKNEFELYASMKPAKEVGGDFYDFFMVDDKHLGLVMADVSGKGVPAALFMVISKTLLKNRTLMGGHPAEVFSVVNNQLCENNKAEMFVTCWLAILDIETGHVIACNAGHEFPTIKRAGGKYELIKDKHGFVLAGMENMKFKEYEFDLKPGDEVFVYTDGVPEATNEQNELFGTDRMLDALNKNPDATSEETIKNVNEAIKDFVLDAPQFDDITMLNLIFKGSDSVKEITLLAVTENVEKVTDFINNELDQYECPMKSRMQIDIAIDELFSNVASYAYGNERGNITVRMFVDKDPLAVNISFIDDGKPYNPLDKEDPDISLSADERDIGGLGIFLVKKSMDDMSYEYKEGQNILTIKKYL